MQLAMAEVDERSAESQLAEYQAIASLRSEDKTVNKAKARAYEDEDFIEARSAFQVAHAYRKLIEVSYENMDADSRLLSRELTRRVGREPRDERTRRWSP